MLNRLVVAGLLMMSAVGMSAQAKTAACPEFDVTGTWSNLHGQFFTIEQKGCSDVRLTRIASPHESAEKFDLQKPIMFKLDGNTPADLSSKSFGGIKQLGGETSNLATSVLDNQKIYTQLTSETSS